MNLAIVGSRDYTNYEHFCEIVIDYIQKNGKPDLIISGGASGVDSLAERYAGENGISMTIYPANWKKYGRAAGVLRNTKIAKACTHMLALPSSTSVGTYDATAKARLQNKQLTIVKI